jgi:hypothetical protein
MIFQTKSKQKNNIIFLNLFFLLLYLGFLLDDIRHFVFLYDNRIIGINECSFFYRLLYWIFSLFLIASSVLVIFKNKIITTIVLFGAYGILHGFIVRLFLEVPFCKLSIIEGSGFMYVFTFLLIVLMIIHGFKFMKTKPLKVIVHHVVLCTIAFLLWLLYSYLWVHVLR